MIRSLVASVLLAGPVLAQDALPFDIGGAYTLINHNGEVRTQVDPDGQPQLLFFGYANCPGICSAALPLMADIGDSLEDAGINVSLVMITVDPARDTVGNMTKALAEYHPKLIGLTGNTQALDVAYKAFSVDHSLAYEDPEYGPVYTHGSMIYLMDANGEVLTMIPPVMDTGLATEVAMKYVAPRG